ncbi:MAG: insulinase family protein, partial [Prevotellaceae bacterium]|jgi:predicted Zn-dependent peptidase|nr:insulinase family protein [Prevotellaceae bacterium]
MRLVFMPDKSPVTYCGAVINVGSRDESEEEQGMAHFVEHMLFKGTGKRRSRHIINRLEDVGGELNAYTSKEETVVYASVLTEYAARAVELIADIVLHSTFPQKEIDKEVEVILDEMQSYNDSPSELIYDDFEEILFDRHPLGHNILGQADLLMKFTQTDALRFVSEQYRPEEMVFFVLGNVDYKRLVRWVSEYFEDASGTSPAKKRTAPDNYAPQRKEAGRNTHQVHFMMGNRAYDLHHPHKLGMHLLNNLLGGQGMNSLLNLSLREKHGLVYQVDSNYQAMTDSGMWNVYFGCDPESAGRCEQLVLKELKKLREQKLPDKLLRKYKLQLTGQLVIANEQKEHLALSLGKSFLRFGKFDELDTLRQRIDAISAEELQAIANEIFDPAQLSALKYS